MAQPTFFSEGTDPRRSDTRWRLLVKWLGAIQNGLGASASSTNNPRRSDTRRILLAKIDAAKVGVPFAG